MRPAIRALTRHPPTLLLAAFLLPGPGASHARALPGGVQLEMTPAELRQAIPALRPVSPAPRLAGGLVGRWSGPSIALAGVPLTPTFFFAQGKLRRVEYAGDGLAQPAGFDALLRWARATWGQEAASEGPEGAYAVWQDDELDVYLQQARGPRRAVLRLVIRPHLAKDGSAL